MDDGKNKHSRNLREVMPPSNSILFPKTNSDLNAVKLDTMSNRSPTPQPRPIRRPGWIVDATTHRSARAQQSISQARTLNDAKQIDPRHTTSSRPNIPNVQLQKIPIETPNPKAKKQHSWLRNSIGVIAFVAVVIIGSFLINQFVMQSFNVTGPSMYPTLDGNDGEYAPVNAGSTSDRLIVNMVPVTIDRALGKTYTPPRGQIIVFRNPQWVAGTNNPDQYVVKRVIGLPGDRITVNNCTLLIHNDAHPAGINPYTDVKQFPLFQSVANPNDCVAGDGTNETVPNGSIFVVGDHRDDRGMQWSMDSRNGNGRPTLGIIPLQNIIGPVAIRIWPLNKISFL
ncbi:MAG: signal peptidase I [Candidatus Nanoperiomorbaceae bacterium]